MTYAIANFGVGQIVGQSLLFYKEITISLFRIMLISFNCSFTLILNRFQEFCQIGFGQQIQFFAQSLPVFIGGIQCNIHQSGNFT